MPFDFFHWAILWVAPLLIVAVMLRRKGWIAALWIPLAAVSVLQSFRVLQVVRANSGPGMEALGGMFALMVGWPWFVVAIFALIAVPRRWMLGPALAGAAVVILGAIALPQAATTSVRVRAIDSSGKPMGNFHCFGTAEKYRVKGARRSFTSDANGEFSFRYDPSGTMTFESEASQSLYGIGLSLNDARKYDARIPEGQIFVNATWRPSGPYQMSQGTVFTSALGSKDPIPLFVKRLDELISPPLQTHIRGILHSVQNGTDTSFVQMDSMCRNAESFALIDDIAAIISKRSEHRTAAIRALGDVAEKLYDIHEFVTNLGRRRETASLGVAEWQLFTAICRWAGVEPGKTIGDSASAIDGKINGYAMQLIVNSRPYWGDENSSINVVKSLREFGRSALPDFPAALAGAHPRGRKMILFALERLPPSVAEVEWAVSSNEPDLVAAAYDGVKDRIREDEKAIAVERLLRINQPGANTRAQMQVQYLLPAFGYSGTN